MSKKDTAAIAVAVLLAGKTLGKRIEALAKTTSELQKEIHLIACSVCVEAVATGNLTHLMQFDKAVEHTGRRQVRRWLAKHGPVKWDTKEERFVFSDVKRAEATTKGTEVYGKELLTGPTYIDEATASDTDPFKAFDLPAILNAIIKRKDNIEDETDARHDFTGLDKLVELVKSLPPKVKTKPIKITKGKATTVEATATIN
jgi:hypothetical protein